MANIAVVGAGYWGPNLIRNFAQQGTLAMVCDLDPKRLAPIQKSYPSVKTTTSFQEVLNSPDVDGIALATPARTHHKLAMQALQHGKHLLIEKPLAMTTRECEDLVEMANTLGRVLMVGHTFLYAPAMLKVKELSTPEYLGDMYYLYTQRVNLGRVQSDMNALWSIAPHDISIAMFLTGETPQEVSARGASYLTSGVEDVVFMTMKFSGSVLAHVHASWIDPGKVRKVTVVGSKRMIVYDDLAEEGKVKVYDKGVFKEENAAYGGFHYKLHSGDIHAPWFPMSEPLANECAHFVQCIQEGKQPLSNGENGLHVVQVLEAAQRSLESGGIPVSMMSQRVHV